jgi:hypothetical protein
MTSKRKPTLNERIAADPELQEILERNDDELIERVKQGNREMRARKEQEARRRERDERRQARLRKLTFGLLGR